jgi:cell division ATPase FtsA
MYFALGDNRKYFDVESLYGVPTSLLKGALSYYFVSDDFYAFITDILTGLGIEKIRFVPSSFAQASYLVPQKRRESYAFLLDIGFLNSSLSVVYGNGIVREESFDCGLGSILAHLMKSLDVEYTVAEEMLYSANISGGELAKDLTWTCDDGSSYPVWKINDVIKCGLDELLEKVNEFFESRYKDKATVAILNAPLLLTGEGLNGMAGLVEYLSNRVARLAETVYPDLPYYDKPSFSSRIALLNVAVKDNEQNGFFYKLMKLFGGKKK